LLLTGATVIHNFIIDFFSDFFSGFFSDESIIMSNRVIVFDFDGTLANTMDAIIEITNRFSEEFGYEKISDERMKKWQNLNSQDIIKTSKVPLVKIPVLLHIVKHELNQSIPNLRPIKGIDSALKTLVAMGYKLAIVSSNSEENIQKFIDLNRWNDFFATICCGTTIFGKAKVLSKLLKTQKLSAENVVYLGDETRDIDAAKKVHIKVIAVTWGFNSRSVLAKHHPDFLIDRPEEILPVISQL